MFPIPLRSLLTLKCSGKVDHVTLDLRKIPILQDHEVRHHKVTQQFNSKVVITQYNEQN